MSATTTRPPAPPIIPPHTRYYNLATGHIYRYVRYRPDCRVHVVRREGTGLTQRLSEREFAQLAPVTFSVDATPDCEMCGGRGVISDIACMRCGSEYR
jgi:hypothetical protein